MVAAQVAIGGGRGVWRGDRRTRIRDRATHATRLFSGSRRGELRLAPPAGATAAGVLPESCARTVAATRTCGPRRHRVAAFFTQRRE
jgi:hypothetical protein